MAKIIAVTGRSGSGKTTLISKLIPILKKRGIRTGSIKQTHHSVPLDTPGKDSDLHIQSGSEITAVMTPDKFGIFSERKNESIEKFAKKYFHDIDLILLEGFKNENVYKMEVFRAETGKKPLCSDKTFHIQTVITDEEGKKYLKGIDSLNFLDIKNPERIADSIENLLKKNV
ncbi:MAG: molybdopterin-guanine dinucleotide biosynthesis protein B [Spirochaetia bacterium]|nr:molybdopterin-guanine dinucleotide biosynthesis protein B [Spirochaetia bacterium]